MTGQTSTSKIVSQFALSTTAHGYAKIASVKFGVKRCFWIIAVMGALCGLGSHIIQITMDYLSYQKNVIINVVPINNDAFPNVILCSTNPWSTHFVNQDKDKKFDTVRQKIYNLTHREFPTREEAVIFVEKVTLESTLDGVLPFSRFLNTLDDILLKCEYQNVKCNLSNFELYDSQHFGWCYKFVPPKLGKAITHKNGLRMFLHVENSNIESEIQHPISKTKGVMLYMITNTTYLNINRYVPLMAPTGSYSSIGLTFHAVKRQSTGNSFCNPNLEIFDATHKGNASFDYKMGDCIDAQVNEKIEKKCGCVNPKIPVYPKLHKIRHCGKLKLNSIGEFENIIDVVKEVKCAEETFHQFMSNVSQLNDCEQACSDVIMENTFTSAALAKEPFQMKEYSEKLVNMYHKILRQNKNTSLVNILNDNKTALKSPQVINNNLLFVDLFVANNQMTVYEEQLSQTLMGFASNIGGVIGLWCGGSVITMIEFLQLIGQLLSHMLNSKCRSSKSTKQFPKNSATVVEEHNLDSLTVQNNLLNEHNS